MNNVNYIARRYVLIALIGFMFITLMSISSAEQGIPPVKLGECAHLTQTCANCTFVNITGIDYPSPNSTSLYFNRAMTQNINIYNYSFCDNIYLGSYTYHTLGNPNGVIVQQSVTYQVTTTGQLLDNSKAILYIVIFVVALLILITSVLAGMFLPSDNKRDEMTGYILATSNVKYLKIFSWGIAYIMCMLILYFAYIISFSFLDMDFLASLSRIGFYITLALALPLFVIFVYVVIANAVRDHKVGEMLSQGLRIK